jgi:hypothetical protein
MIRLCSESIIKFIDFAGENVFEEYPSLNPSLIKQDK